jgi:hypothetical protein
MGFSTHTRTHLFLGSSDVLKKTSNLTPREPPITKQIVSNKESIDERRTKTREVIVGVN